MTPSAYSLLPRGNLLRPDVWAQRHRMITRFALFQAVCLGLFGLSIGRGVAESAVAAAIVAAPALFAMQTWLPRTPRMLAVVISLMAATMFIVTLTRGMTQALFHLILMLGIVSLYQSWAAFSMCVLIAVVRHAVMGILDPNLVFLGVTEREHPARWMAVHTLIVVAASVTHLITWKLSEQQELQDPLTRLANRASFIDQLRAALRRSDGPVSVLYLDIDKFKAVNDLSGHGAGDLVLCHVARTMSSLMPPHAVVARVGADEFAVIARCAAGAAEIVAEELLAELRAPLSINGCQVFTSVSIGVADTTTAGSRDAEELARDAGAAMGLAKSSGRNRVVSYTAGVGRPALEQAVLLQELRAALVLGQFEIHYQPVFRFRGDERWMCGVEALVRWRHPVRGLVPPDEFIPLAEESGDIRAIGAWVLRTAAAQVAQWQCELPGCARLELAVNLSPAQLRDPALLPHIGAVLQSGLACGTLIIEITETILLADLDRARLQLNAVRTLGARISIDDFGTGYSSLSYLARLPIDQIKIDRSFVKELGASATSAALVRSIVELARALDLDVQAEGVEEVEQQQILTDLGCPRSQGYLYSRPLPVEDFVTFAKADRPALPLGRGSLRV